MGKAKRLKELKKKDGNFTVLTWEEVDGLRQETLKELMSQKMLLDALTENAKEELDKDPKLSRVVTGMYNSYGDIVEKVRVVQNGHMTPNEEGKLVPKSGNIELGSDSYHSAMGVANNYINLGEQVAEISTIGFTDVFSSLKAKGYKISDADIKKTADIYMKGAQDVQIASMGGNPGPSAEKRAKARAKRKAK